MVKVENIKETAGIAGQLSVSAVVTYEGEAPRVAAFTGSVYGGPVAYTFELSDGRMISGFVSMADRFGDFGTEWVRRFFES